MNAVVRFDPPPPGAAAETARPARVQSGDPQTRTLNCYSDAGERFHAGVWESTPGRWQVDYSEHEFVHLLQGEVVLTDAAGRSERFVAGDSFVVPAGFRGSWETVRPVRKLYAIYLPGAE